MIQVNLLLDMDGRPQTSFVMLDLMRLPLGILSGMGFIGAGAIIRKDDLVLGVTTAATLWFVTVMGLCFGGGQLILGLVALALAFLVLTILKEIEARVKQDSRGVVTLKLASQGPTDAQVSGKFEGNGFRIASWRVLYSKETETRQLSFTVHWRRSATEMQAPPLIAELAETAGVLEIGWCA
jgi:putative Mg2+ transporter-C (MgtC) family protein